MANKALQLTLIKSLAKRLPKHKACAHGLGLKRIRQSVKFIDPSPSIWGMVNKIAYLLKIEEN